mgnify:CR=1 FL=1
MTFETFIGSRYLRARQRQAFISLITFLSIAGVAVGVMALIVLPEVFREFELYRMLAVGGAMTLMMVFRPQGLIPAKRVGTRSEEKEG